MRSFLLIGFHLIVGISFSQSTGTITDSSDGKVYKTVVIGSQTWMSENLNVSTFRNGDPIPEAKTNEEWKKARMAEWKKGGTARRKRSRRHRKSRKN